jgi:AcrR family transcriptional regulator
VSASAAAPKKRGRPQLISADSIVDATLKVATAEGAHAVSMARVAAELGVASPALYNHVRSLDDLLGRAAGRLFEGLPIPSPELAWDEWIVESAFLLRSLMLENPILTRVPFLPAHVGFPPRMLEHGLAALQRGGFVTEHALTILGEHVRHVVDLVRAETSRAHSASEGRNVLTYLRETIETVDPDEIPLLIEAVGRWDRFGATLPAYGDRVFDWHMRIEVAGLRAMREGEFGPPWELPQRNF